MGWGSAANATAARTHRGSRAAVLVFAAMATACGELPTQPEPTPGAAAALEATITAVVVFDAAGPVPASQIAAINAVGGTVTKRIDAIGVAVATLPNVAALDALRGSPGVALVGVDRMTDFLRGVRVRGVLSDAFRRNPPPANDPTQAARYAVQWNLRVIGADRAWARGHFGSPAVKVAILDTGIDYTNRELSGLVDLTLSKSISPEPVAPGEHAVMDYHFHGTHVASSVTTNNITIAGVAPGVRLFGVKVLTAVGTGLFSWGIEGIVYAADAGARVINMSLGAEVHEVDDAALIESTRRAVQYAESKGALVIAAAGNDAADLDAENVVYLPCEAASLCVSATGPLMQQNFDQPATYTNYGAGGISVAAPGGNSSDTEDSQTEDLILGACSTRATNGTLVVCRTSGLNGYYYAWAAGTSMATPHVSGKAAMIYSRWPGWSAANVKARLLNNSDDLGDPGHDMWYGAGRINVSRALPGN
jgi:lantibiotic leader peptide-processing serine protease